MKTLKLKKLNNFDYKEVLLAMLKNAPEKGYTVDDIRKAMKAIDVLEAAKDEVEFEDDVFNFVKDVVSQAKYRMASKEIIGLFDDLGI